MAEFVEMVVRLGNMAFEGWIETDLESEEFLYQVYRWAGYEPHEADSLVQDALEHNQLTESNLSGDGLVIYGDSANIPGIETVMYWIREKGYVFTEIDTERLEELAEYIENSPLSEDELE